MYPATCAHPPTLVHLLNICNDLFRVEGDFVITGCNETQADVIAETIKAGNARVSAAEATPAV